MKTSTQIMTILLIGALGLPVVARFVPASHPWLDRMSLLQPLMAVGVVPAVQADDQGGARANGPPGGGGVTVIATELRQQVLRDVVSSIGSAEGAQAVDVAFQVTGRLRALHVAPGDRVTTGQTLAELDAQSAELAVERARLVLDDAQRNLDRFAQLAQSGTVTNLQQQDAELALRTAELGLRAAERDLQDHTILAPISGYAGLIEPQVGDLVTPSSIITRIEDRSGLIVDFRVPERLAAKVALGDSVQASAISFTSAPIVGQIIAIDNRLDEASRTLRVRAAIPNEKDLLRAGMAFQITMEMTGDSFPAVDPLAIQWGGSGAFVWVVRAGKAHQVPIRILQRNAADVLIDASFEPGDMVVTQGVQALRPGVDVTIAPMQS